MWAASRNWENQWNGFLPTASEKSVKLLTFWFWSRYLGQTSDSQTIGICCYKALFVMICYNSHRTQIYEANDISVEELYYRISYWLQVVSELEGDKDDCREQDWRPWPSSLRNWCSYHLLLCQLLESHTLGRSRAPSGPSPVSPFSKQVQSLGWESDTESRADLQDVVTLRSQPELSAIEAEGHDFQRKVSGNF